LLKIRGVIIQGSRLNLQDLYLHLYAPANITPSLRENSNTKARPDLRSVTGDNIAQVGIGGSPGYGKRW
jgi:hypothetical protein